MKLARNYIKNLIKTQRTFGSTSDYTAEFIRHMNESVKEHKNEIIGKKFTTSEMNFSVPETAEMQRLDQLAGKYRSDPFIPESIRERVVTLLDKRNEMLLYAYVEVGTYYMNALAQGKYWHNLTDDRPGLHNIVNKYLYDHGVGISQVEEEVHQIRLDIQNYFANFNPFYRSSRKSSLQKKTRSRAS